MGTFPDRMGNAIHTMSAAAATLTGTIHAIMWTRHRGASTAAGVVRSIAASIAWQRAQRPPIGRLAVEHGFLAHDDVGVILERRREAGANATPFGEWAVRLGYLTPFQVLALLGMQLRLQRPIGQWFVARGIVGVDEIDAIRSRIFRHNARFGRDAPHPVT